RHRAVGAAGGESRNRRRAALPGILRGGDGDTPQDGALRETARAGGATGAEARGARLEARAARAAGLNGALSCQGAAPRSPWCVASVTGIGEGRLAARHEVLQRRVDRRVEQ